MADAKDPATNWGTTTKAGRKRARPGRELSLRIWAALATLRTGFRRRGAAKAGCLLALLLFGGAAMAGNDQGTALRTTAAEAPATAGGPSAQTATATPAPEKIPGGPPKISYVGGQLRIDALDATLADVLKKVAALTGVKIDVPAGADSERMPIVELGPGPARQVLASLLSDSSFDYLIQDSDTDPDKIQGVLLIPREKKGSGTNGMDLAARPSRGPSAQALAKPEEAPAPDSPVPPQPENAAAEAMALNPQPASTQLGQPAPPLSAQADLSGQFPLLQPDTSNPAKPGALTPPPMLSPQSINQQLLQMYQQRVQMTQQDHFTGTQPPIVIPGGK